jgi:hypothetical protein
LRGFGTMDSRETTALAAAVRRHSTSGAIRRIDRLCRLVDGIGRRQGARSRHAHVAFAHCAHGDRRLDVRCRLLIPMNRPLMGFSFVAS